MADYKDPDAFYDARFAPVLKAIKDALRDVPDSDGKDWPYAQAFSSLCERVLAIAEATGPVGGWSYAQAFSSLCDRVLQLSKDITVIKADVAAIKAAVANPFLVKPE